MKVVLASTSPRRKGLLKGLFSEFSVIAPNAEEKEEGDPKEIAVENARLKGRSVTEPCDLLIACDTVVCLGGKIYGKPKDAEDAVKMLKDLSGKTHSVVSGVYLRVGEKESSFFEESFVTMKEMTDGEIRAYVKNYNPIDKAGAYGIQDDEVVERYDGDYDNIVGLPVSRIREETARLL